MPEDEIGPHRPLRAGGQERVEISWVGPVVPYARVGACVSDAFRALRLPAPENGCVRLGWAVAPEEVPF